MFAPGKHANELAEHELKTALRLPGLKLRDRRLITDDEL